MKYKNILAAALCLPLLSSCLEKTPSDYLPIGEGMNSVTAATQLVNGMYNTLKGKALYSGYLTLCPDIQADLVHAVMTNEQMWGRDLTKIPGFEAGTVKNLTLIREKGAKAAYAACL